MTITGPEQVEIDRANQSDSVPIVFVHGMWLLAGSWQSWRDHVGAQGFATLAPGWPDDPVTVDEARKHPEVLAGKGVGQVTGHYTSVIRALERQPVVIGHGFGGLIAQKLAGLGLARAAVAIDPAPFRGVLRLPLSTLKACSAVLRNPRNYNRSVMLTEKQFRFAFGNAGSVAESDDLYRRYAVPAPGRPVFQAATANLNPRTEASVDTRNPERGPMLLISGEKDNTVPWALANAAFNRQGRNPDPTEITELRGRGHALVIDSGWQEVADTALEFLTKHRVIAS